MCALAGMNQKSKQYLAVTLAAGFYLAWTILLFAPHRQSLSSLKLLFAVAPPLAAMGVFLLSRRWLSSWMPSAAAGLIYGFGPFGASFLSFHPVTGLAFAVVPWLLLPSVYWNCGLSPGAGRLVIRAAMCGLPFIFIIGFFWVFSLHWIGPLFLLPKNELLNRYDFGGLVLPLSMTGRQIVFGIYHAPLIAAMMGTLVYLSAQRVLTLAVPAVGLVLAFLDPVFGVSPVIWAALPMVFLAILAGLGLQSLLFAGKSDAKWVLTCFVGGIVCAMIGVAMYLPDRAEVYVAPAVFYTASAAGMGVLFAISRLGIRVIPLRWLILAAMIAADCYFSGRWLIDRIL